MLKCSNSFNGGTHYHLAVRAIEIDGASEIQACVLCDYGYPQCGKGFFNRCDIMLTDVEALIFGGEHYRSSRYLRRQPLHSGAPFYHFLYHIRNGGVRKFHTVHIAVTHTGAVRKHYMRQTRYPRILVVDTGAYAGA